MSGITSREQFLQVLGDAEQVTTGLLAHARQQRRALLEVLAKHLAFARTTLNEGQYPTREQQTAVNMAGVAAQLAPGAEGENTDPHTAWLHATLPLLDAYFRSLAPPEPFAWGAHVTVPWPSGQRYLGFIRLVHEQTYLVAFGNGSQQWLRREQIQPGPSVGEPMTALDAEGRPVRGSLKAVADGCYHLDIGDGTTESFEWTHVQPG